MAFSRDRIQTIIANETLTPGEKVDQIFAMHGQTLENYVSKKDIEAIKAEAVAGVKIPDPVESDAYKKLEKDFNDFKTKQAARSSDDFSGVKAKFFDQVYDAIDHSKPIPGQLEEMRKTYAEFFEEEKQPEEVKPQFASGTEGEQPKGGNGTFASYWGFDK